MKVIKILFLSLLPLLFYSNTPGQHSWSGIIPLVTTRSQVEAKIGKPGQDGRYEFSDGRVWIKYVETQCGHDCVCMVPLDTVQFIAVDIYYDLSVKSLRPRKDFRRVPDSHQPDIISYVNDKTGVRYVTQKGEVYTIYYSESAATCRRIERRFRQQNTAKRKPTKH